ncbi:DUF1932 domain-containing protein [Falsirhodobacter sp. 1013]|uniref:NAD(P)-dependent oxidoreductase n=1 Tax=Falsirhodobacter sp. 1013 TaxID=3417566 RepID=UPI003EB7AE3F
MTHITFLGFGEAAQSIAAGLKGKARMSAFDLRFAQGEGPLRDAAAARGVTPLNDLAGIADSDIVLSLVVGSAARNVASDAAPHLGRGTIYLDLNSVGPATKAEAATAIAGGAGVFVEGAVMARVPPHGERVPVLVAGAEAQRAADTLNPLGMKLEVVGTGAGQASALKMIRSVMVKGVEALLIEALTAAERAGVTERILDSVGETFPGIDWRETADYYLSRSFEHGQRRVTEMTEAAETIEQLGLAAEMSRAACRTIATAHAGMQGHGLTAQGGYRAFVPVLAAQGKI